MKPLTVVCTRFRMSEEDRLGGFCAFDITFVELGAPPFQPIVNSYQQLIAASQGLRDYVQQTLAGAGIKP